MSWPKNQFASAAATALLLLASSVIHADTYRDAKRHFTLEIPPGWRELPVAEVERLNKARPPSASVPRLSITGGIVKADQPPGTGPITMIIAYDPGSRGCSNEEMIQKFAPGENGSMNKKDGTLKELIHTLPLRDLFRQGPLGGGVVDRGQKWIINRYSVQTPKQTMQHLEVTHLGADGFVKLQSQFHNDDANVFLPVFVTLNESFRFDEGHGPSAIPIADGPVAPAAAPSRLNNVVIVLAVVAGVFVLVCAAVIGFVVFLVVRSGRKEESTNANGVAKARRSSRKAD